MSTSIRVRMKVTDVSSNTDGGQKIVASASLGGPQGYPVDRSAEARDAWERKDPAFRRGNPFHPVPNETFLSDNPPPYAHEASGAMELTINRAANERFVAKGDEIWVDIQVAGAPQTDVDVEAGRVLARDGKPLPADANEDVRRGHAEHRGDPRTDPRTDPRADQRTDHRTDPRAT